MEIKKSNFSVIVLILGTLACNLGTPALTPSPTLDSTAEANSILATGFAQLTASAQSSTPAGLPTETPSPLAALPPLFTAIPTNTFTPIPTITNTQPPGIPDWPLVRQGDDGPVVAALQYLLNFKGQNLNVDGDFGPLTRTAVISFQTQSGLEADGIVGPLTWSALIQGAQIQEGSTSPAVRAAQHLLRNKYGYGISVDGIFGPQTENAVRDFQTSHGLGVDGIVGPQTWQALISY